MCRRYSIPSLIGAFTPTEILTAWETGADFIKVHPASLGGPKYFKDVLAPFPHIKLIPSGGVTLDNAAGFHQGGRGGGGAWKCAGRPESHRRR